MQSTLASFALLAILFISSTSHAARPASEQSGDDMKGEAMLKNQTPTDMRVSGSNKKPKSDTKDELVEDDEHFPIDCDEPLFKGKKTEIYDDFGTLPDLPIYDDPLLKGTKIVADEPKP